APHPGRPPDRSELAARLGAQWRPSGGVLRPGVLLRGDHCAGGRYCPAVAARLAAAVAASSALPRRPCPTPRPRRCRGIDPAVGELGTYAGLPPVAGTTATSVNGRPCTDPGPDRRS